MDLSSFVPYFTILVIFVAFWLIYKEILRPTIGLMGAIIIFMLMGILSPQDGQTLIDAAQNAIDQLTT